MDVVQSRIRELSGQIQIQSELGRGSRFMIRVPLTLAILPTLLVQAGEAVYALPLARVVEVLHAPQTSLGWFDGRAVLDRRSHTLPLIDLRSAAARKWRSNRYRAPCAACPATPAPP